ncbi:AbrB/MazE/SpoVT family DNA-binding domain-containing protein [Edaphobacter flagellatus]|uniref:AbrB/MazE/SpoVT family DNA-binding domain-containing protein n=1 Tax=Edaphobacter flagellatus TaxID=1933044 RepID=UPI0021B41978|nr:AbrB/MazE/SpoVT family DNA-binding domain-containing protein [Edaphobacter flagellatus]
MATTTKIMAIGNSSGIILPKEVMARLHVERGDHVFIVETPNGVELTPYDEDFAETMEIARNVMRENRDVLRKLAK